MPKSPDSKALRHSGDGDVMAEVLARYGLDRRFVELTVFMTLGAWLCGIVLTLGMVLLGGRIILLHQMLAVPFSVLGWGIGYRLGQAFGFGPRATAMAAGWVALLTAEVGLALIINWLWTGSGGAFGGLLAFPVLAVLVTIGVLWLYRAERWKAHQSAFGKDAG